MVWPTSSWRQVPRRNRSGARSDQCRSPRAMQVCPHILEVVRSSSLMVLVPTAPSCSPLTPPPPPPSLFFIDGMSHRRGPPRQFAALMLGEQRERRPCASLLPWTMVATVSGAWADGARIWGLAGRCRLPPRASLPPCTAPLIQREGLLQYVVAAAVRFSPNSNLSS
jgi:hypothetical protein